MMAEGFCVVSLRDKQRWIEGDPQTAAEFDGHGYLFASQRELAMFAAAPERYAPMLGGDCPVAYAESGNRTPGRIEFAAVHKRRLVFCSSAEAREKFRDDPELYENVDLAFDGKCPVSLVENHRSVRGLDATATTYEGLRYLFAHDLARRMFLANPKRYAAPTAIDQNPRPQAVEDLSPSATARPALGGYCPVTLRTRGEWVRGQKKYRVEVAGRFFDPAGRAERDVLLADPQKYLPALGGDCAVSYAETGERVPGSIYHAAFVGEQLYLFATAEQLAKFVADKDAYRVEHLSAR